MKKKEIVHPDNIKTKFSTGAYSAGVVANGMLYISGQGPIDFTTGKFVLGDIVSETHLTMHNVKRICEAAGCTLDDIVKCTVHLTDINEFDEYNKVYGSYFSGVRPARTTVQSVLGHGIRVEIDAIAVLPETNKDSKQ